VLFIPAEIPYVLISGVVLLAGDHSQVASGFAVPARRQVVYLQGSLLFIPLVIPAAHLSVIHWQHANGAAARLLRFVYS